MSIEKTIETLLFTASPENENETVITITEGEFAGTVYKYGRVWFPNENEPVMSFDYDIVNASVNLGKNKEEFLNLIGLILQNLLLKAIDEQTAIFAGGTNVSEGTVEEILDTPKLFEPPPVDSKILTPWSYKLPEPEPGTKMSRNLLEGL